MAKQYSIYFETARCVQCHACEVACKATNLVELGLKWRTVVNVWKGEYPYTINQSLSFACQHCSESPCVKACPTKAITKDGNTGITVVDAAKCIGCHSCLMACPFGVPQFGSDGKMQKCHLCFERLKMNKEPACVATCPAEALKFGEIRELSGRTFHESAQRVATRAF